MSFVCHVKAFGGLTDESILQKESNAALLSRQWSGDSIRRSVNLYEEASGDWEKIGKTPRASFCLREAAKLYVLLSDYKNALISLKKALAADRKNNFSEGKTITLSLLSLVSRLSGQTKASENYYKQALQSSKLSFTDYAQAMALFSAAEFNNYYGSKTEAVELYKRALSFAEKTDDKNLAGQILLNMGISYSTQGNSVYGLQKIDEALAKWQEIDDKRGQAIAFSAMGFVHNLIDEKQTALDFYKKAELMFPEDLEWLEKGRVSNGIAQIYEQYGVLNLAEQYRLKALEFYRKADYPYGQLATLPSLAKLSYLKGDKNASEKLYDEALIFARKLNSAFHVAIIEERLGEMHFDNGSFDDAVKNYRDALKVYQKLKIKLPRVQNSLGLVFVQKRKLDLAREYFNSALDANRRIKDMVAAAENLYNLAKIDESEGNTQTALDQIKESLTITESLYNNVANNNLRRNYLSNVFERYECYINLLMKLHRQFPHAGYEIRALQASEKSRARSMLETLSLSEANLIKDADSETVNREKEIRRLLNVKADKLTDLLSKSDKKSEIDKLSDEINDLTDQLEEIKANLKQSSPIYSSIKNPAPFDVQDFQSGILDENSVLLEFSFGKDESYLWLIGKNRVESFILPGRDQIEAPIRRLRELLSQRERKTDLSIEDYQANLSKAESLYRQEAQILSDELLGQVADRIAGKRLIIVADGKLNLFPIGALPFPRANSGAPILSSNEVVYEPSALMLIFLKNSQNNLISPKKNLLVFADPIFSARDERLAPDNKSQNAETPSYSMFNSFSLANSLDSLPRLIESEKEADSIVEMVGAAAESEIFSGAAANLDNALNQKISDYKIIHFATHSYLNEERPELSAIVLSQFNESGEKQNGLLRLQDIYSLNLNSNLVVLSACDTGGGREVKGEGLTSLNNAFLQVGAKSVLSSLWKVDDNATKELMKDFYRGLATENLTASESLRRAQIKLSQNPQYASPFYWAAFTVHGDFQNAPQLSTGFGNKIYVLLILPVLIFGLFRFVKAGLFNRKTVGQG